MAKPDYHGKDFFQRKEFRGLLLADYQEAIGEKAFACVDQLNTDTVSKFSQLQSFRDAISKKKVQEKFYKTKDVMNTSKSSRGGSVTDRNMRHSLISKNSHFRQSKGSDANVGSANFNKRLAGSLQANKEYKVFGNIDDDHQLKLVENANHVTTSHSTHPYYVERGRKKPDFPEVNRQALLQEAFNT